MTDETGKRVVPVVAAVVSLLALGWLVLPFEGGGQVDCRVSVGGTRPTRSLELGAITPREAKACRDAGMSRAITAGFVALFALVAAGATVVMPPEDERDWPASWFGVSPPRSVV